ncbi:YbcC family protein [Pseudoalteromonas tetraodonis]|uniref:YbcC family protein n=1 Tax=Pseudoalteromonas tetraodonis TaxID=43659 RepID=UPI003A97BB76
MSSLTPSNNTVLSLSDSQNSLLNKVCGYIAPNWPLDQMIAVNPFWEMRHMPIEDVSARLDTLCNANMLMPKDFYQHKYDNGIITDNHLADAAKLLNSDFTHEQLIQTLHIDVPLVDWHNIADLLDQQRNKHKMAWHDEITHQLSQFCAAHYQQLGPMLHGDDTSPQSPLYRHWLTVIQADKGISIVMDEKHLNGYFKQLPTCADELIALTLSTLNIDNDSLELYAHSLLLDINGWASWLAYLRFQGQLYAKPKDDMKQLLAMRMAWDLVIWQYLADHDSASFKQLQSQWQQEKSLVVERLHAHKLAQKPLWVWAKALELSYQYPLNHALQSATKTPVNNAQLQAVFCIDVRSEVIRRALESQSKNIETFGFAGFFGLPLEYQENGSAITRPQLPGLLKPDIHATQTHKDAALEASRQNSATWQSWSKSAPSSFSMVESAGWLYAFKLIKNTFLSKGKAKKCATTNWQLTQNQQQLTLKDKTDLAQKVLNTLGIKEFAPHVMLVGHASHTTNNLHSAGLECGACGGQSGEVNVRVLANLLNDTQVRQALKERGLTLAQSTQFIAAIHNTTTDVITAYDTELNDNLKKWLTVATQTAQQERLINIDPQLVNKTADEINHAYHQRARDWSQVRPEWGLANNAAFIVAPRAWTRSVNLQGRCFLHDYEWENDNEFAVLELIMTAPMIVTHWINSQYNASVTDNHKYGSGNKILHNAVGGNIGLFEGNGGDLRIGLAMQSLHNGEKWMHEPIRLNVYIAAPQSAIAAIYNKHVMVKELIDNHWLTLIRWGDDNTLEQFENGHFSTISASNEPI